MIRWFRYVGYGDLPWRLRQGWAPVADLGPTHARWSVLRERQGPGDPP